MSSTFEYSVQTQFYDFDQLGIAHNVVYIRWIEDARTAFLRASPWSIERMIAEDISPALTRTEIDFRKPIRFGDPLAVHLQMTKAGRSSWSIMFHMLHPQTGIVYASGSQSGCFVRPSTGRPVPMPSDFLTFCSDYLVHS